MQQVARGGLVALLVVVALALVGQREATADPCKADGQTCRTSRSCCGGVCVGGGPQVGFGTCCTPDCTGKQCGDDGCGGSCGSCTAPETCGGGGTPNVCGTTTTTTTTTTSTTTTQLPCQISSDPVEPTCGGACPAGESCKGELTQQIVPNCSCYPDDVTPCLASGYPTCGGFCTGGRVCQAVHILPGEVPELRLCVCVDPQSVCAGAPGSCFGVGACAPGEVCEGQGPPTSACGCSATP